MITSQQLLAIVIGCLFVGVIIGMYSWYLVGMPKCDHKWEKIIDKELPSTHTAVFMCSKCGKCKKVRV